ncbi:hypothetical protein IHV09_01755 [Fictibacillus sp. 23RED33]|uniref:hypothetical protein n=1 Tax=Fictibacillus sp. 23RED33 TaxID=2745879 RepID=UPI0018CD3CDF|nr:hypothetical protein [Fictibacillus sp. 23RED33]MBH0172259.1 hypothetical protein [Fictibacillus sp. 23RED33]
MHLGDELRFTGGKSDRSGGEFTVTGGYDMSTGRKRPFTGERVTEIRTRTVKCKYLI